MSNKGLKIKKYYKILVKDFKELTVLILNTHACFESRDLLLVKYFPFFLNITPSNRSTRDNFKNFHFEITQGEIILPRSFPFLCASVSAESMASLIVVSLVARLLSLSSPISFLLWKNTIETSQRKILVVFRVDQTLIQRPKRTLIQIARYKNDVLTKNNCACPRCSM